MKLVIGGAYQGKLAYAKKTYGGKDGWADGEYCRYSELFRCRGVYHFHSLLRRMLKEALEEEQQAKALRDPGGQSDNGSCPEKFPEEQAQAGGQERALEGGSGPADDENAFSENIGPGRADDRNLFRGITGDLTGLEELADRMARELMQENPELVIVTNELGCGVVPMDRTDRLWRELTGRVCTCLAEEADEVVRVFCGIGVRLR